MTAAELIAQAARRLSDAGVPEPELDAKLLFLEAFHMDQVHFLMNPTRPLLPPAELEAKLDAIEQKVVLSVLHETANTA